MFDTLLDDDESDMGMFNGDVFGSILSVIIMLSWQYADLAT